MYPRRNAGWMKEVLLGTLLAIGSPLVVPGLVVCGYCYRVIQAGIDASMELPSFAEWRSLLRQGWRLPVVIVAYGAIPGALFVGKPFVPLGGVAAIGLDLLVTLTALGAAYVLPMGLARMADEGSVAAAFDMHDIGEIVLTREYVNTGIAWLLAITGILVPIGLFVLFPPMIPFALAITFYVVLVWMYFIGRVYGLATGRMATADTGRSSPRF